LFEINHRFGEVSSELLVCMVSRGWNHNKHCYSLDFTMCESPVTRVDSRTQRGSNGLSWFGLSGPYVQQQMILVFKSTQNRRVTTRSVRDLAGDRSVLILGSSAVRSPPC
jgi:hypothetical protein